MNQERQSLWKSQSLRLNKKIKKTGHINSPWKGGTSIEHEAFNKNSDIYSKQTTGGRAKGHYQLSGVSYLEVLQTFLGQTMLSVLDSPLLHGP